MPREFDDIRDGTALEPYHLNMIYRELRRLRKMTVAGSLSLDNMTSTTSPPFLWSIATGGITIVKTSSTITAMSGTTLGTGTATPQRSDGTDLANDGDDIDIVSYSGVSIASGKYGAVASIGEDFVIISVAC